MHMYIGRGGAPEGVLAACGLKCLGGDMQARLVPENEDQVERCRKMGIEDTKKILTIDDLVKGDDCMFTATAITNCDMLRGSTTSATVPVPIPFPCGMPPVRSGSWTASTPSTGTTSTLNCN